MMGSVVRALVTDLFSPCAGSMFYAQVVKDSQARV